MKRCKQLRELFIGSLTLAKHCSERSVSFPTVSVNCFCDLNITNNRMRQCFGCMSYQATLYAACPIALLCKDRD